MKKLAIVLLAGLLLTGLVGCNKTEPKGSIERVTAEEIMQRIDADETLIFYVGLSDCKHCKAYHEALESYMKDHALHVYYVEADDAVNEEAMDRLMDEYFPTLEYTPTTYYIKDGETIDEMVGEMDESQIELWLNRNEIVLE